MTQDSARPLGEWLRQRREELGISLEQAEVETRIRRRYLEALETEDLDSLPDPFVGRGFLRNYAGYLGLDADEATRLFTQIGAPPPPPVPPLDDSAFRSEPFRPVPLHHMPGFRGRRGWIAGLVLLGVAAAAFVGWWLGAPYFYRWMYGESVPPRPTMTDAAALATGESPAAPTLDSSTATATATRATATATRRATASPEVTLTLTWTPSPSPSPSPPIYTGIFMELVFTGTSWIQVTVDGVREFQGELTADTYRSWYGEERIELRVGNAGAVLVTLNGQSLGTLGRAGEVMDRVFERAGAGWAQATGTVTPTVETGPTQEFTPEPTAAPTTAPTRTPTIQPTEAISPTEPISPTVNP